MISAMARRVARFCTLVLLVNVVAVTPSAADWRRIETPNFIVIGDVGEGQLREVAMQFEGFRDTLSQILAPDVTATAVPTVVIVFPNERAFNPFRPVYNGKPVQVSGVFYGARDVNYITLLADGQSHSLRVLFHEYAHLVASNLTRNLPVWLSEGLAEFYSTYEPQGSNRVLIGTPIESHLRLLNQQRPLPLETLIKVSHDSPLYNEGERRSMFYAQSWALTHMLLMGKPRRIAELAAFQQYMTAGLAEPEAWRKAFGDLQIERELAAYIMRFQMQAYQIDLPQKIAQFKGIAIPVAAPDVQALLAGLHRRQQRPQDAEQLLAGGKPGATSPQASVVRAQFLIDGNDLAGATRILLALDASSDWFVRYLAGVTMADVIERNRGQAGVDVAGAALNHFDAVSQQREIPNALARRAQVALSQRDLAGARTAIERAYRLAPGREDYAFIFASVLGQQGNIAGGRAVLLPLTQPSNPARVRAGAQNVLDFLAKLEASQLARSLGGRGMSTVPAAAQPADVAVTPTAEYTPVYRVTQPGEQRYEGILDRVECPAKGGPIFHVRVAEAPTTFSATSFDAVDFITYRKEQTGSITCGPLKSPRHVYVTVRVSGPDARSVVAIEFLRD